MSALVKGPWRKPSVEQPAIKPRICWPLTHRWTAGIAERYRQRLICSRCGREKAVDV